MIICQSIFDFLTIYLWSNPFFLHFSSRSRIGSWMEDEWIFHIQFSNISLATFGLFPYGHIRQTFVKIVLTSRWLKEHGERMGFRTKVIKLKLKFQKTLEKWFNSLTLNTKNLVCVKVNKTQLKLKKTWSNTFIKF